MISFSVVICTRNRAAMLPSALQSALGQSFPASRYEILVVDNAPLDRTRPLVQAACSDLNIRLIDEPRVGVAAARNAGWRAATGEVVAYLDDDCLADRQWLERLETRFDAGPAAAVGGRVSLLWESPRPSWLTADLLQYVSLVDLGNEPRAIRATEWLSGGNLAIRREFLQSLGGFREDLGRRGKRLTAEEETDFLRRAMRSGLACVYDPCVLVFHHVQRHRLKREWFLRRSFWGGFSLGRAEKIRTARSLFAMGMPQIIDAVAGRRPLSVVCGAVKAMGYVVGATSLLVGRPSHRRGSPPFSL